MSIPLEVLVDAMIFSNLLVLLSVGLTLTYLTLKVANFAHGEFITIGSYVALVIYRSMGLTAYFSLPASFLMSGFTALAVYLLIFRPLFRRGIPLVGMMIASIAVSIILRSIMHIYADTATSLYKIFFRGFILPELYFTIGNQMISSLFIFSTLLSVVIILGLHIVLTYTKLGISMRAAIENPSLASTLGINVELIYAISWFLAGGLAGMAGALIPIRIPCDPEIGWSLLLRIFAAAILGGLDSIYGAILGSYIVGWTEVIGTYVLSRPPIGLSTAYRPAIPFAIIIVTLLIAPRGIAGLLREKVKVRGD